MTLNYIWWWASGPKAPGNVEYPFIANTSRFTLAQILVPDRVRSMSQIELFDHWTMLKKISVIKLIY